MRRLGIFLAVLLTGCQATAAPTPQVIYVTPAPTHAITATPGATTAAANASAGLPTSSPVPSSATLPRGTPVPTKTPKATPAPPPGWQLYTGRNPSWALALPPDWGPSSDLTEVQFQAQSPTDGSLFIVFDNRPIAKNFAAYLADHLAEERRVSGHATVTKRVTLSGGSAIKDTTDLFGVGPSANYIFASKGNGVVSLVFASSYPFTSLDPSEPGVWDQIANVFNPYAEVLP